MTDAVIEKTEKNKLSIYEVAELSSIDAFNKGYTLAHEEAKALVGKMYDALYAMRMDTYYDRSSMPSQIKCVEMLEKAQAFMEGK